jgi:hypothetical protein
METALETKILDLVMIPEHAYLIIGIFGVLMLLKKFTPVANFLFSPKWCFLVVFVNLALSCIGVFLIRLTSFTTIGMKIVLVIVASALCTFAYEGASYVFEKVITKFMGKKPDDPAPSPPVVPAT